VAAWARQSGDYHTACEQAAAACYGLAAAMMRRGDCDAAHRAAAMAMAIGDEADLAFGDAIDAIAARMCVGGPVSC